MKKIELILTAVLFLATMNLFPQRQQIGSSNTYWEVVVNGNDSTLKITGSGDMPDFDDAPWYSIAKTFSYLEMDDDITRIGNYSFFNCEELTGALTLPLKLISIGRMAFTNCDKITSIEFPIKLNYIGTDAFISCYGLTSITLPAALSTIEDGAFYNYLQVDGLQEITNLNATPILISSSVFYGTDKSTCQLIVSTASVPLYRQAPEWKDFLNITGGGISVSAQPNFPTLGEVSGLENRFYTAGETVTLLAEPAQGVDFVHWQCNGEIISTENPFTFTVTQDTVLTAYFENIVSIHSDTAGGLKNNLVNAKTIRKLIVTGDIDARDIQFIRDSITLLSELDVSGATITAYNGTQGTNYGNTVSYPANELPVYSFSRYINMDYISKKMFYSVILPANLISIGDYAFFNCDTLTQTLMLPDGLASIGFFSFFNCNLLVNFTLPESLQSIGEFALANCKKLKEITNRNPVPQIIDANVFQDVNTSVCTLKVPMGSISLYQQAPVWKDFLIEEDVAIVDCNVLTSNISIYPNPVKDILYFQSSSTIEQVSIYDISGRMFKQFANSSSEINISNLASGIYLLKIRTEEGETVQKIIKR
jgi:hypothetical protein